MRISKPITLFLLQLLLVSMVVAARGTPDNTLILHGTPDNVLFRGNIDYYHDTTGQLRIDDLLQNPEQYEFVSAGRRYVNIESAPSGTFTWVRFTIDTEQPNTDIYIELGIPDLITVIPYMVTHGQATQGSITGMFEVTTERPYRNLFPIISAALDDSGDALIYLQIEASSIFTPISFWLPKRFGTYNQERSIIYGIIIGLLFTPAIIYLLLGLLSSRRTLLFYSLYLMLINLSCACIYGYILIPFPWFTAQFGQRVTYIIIMATMFTWASFLSRFLFIKERFPVLWRVTVLFRVFPLLYIVMVLLVAESIALIILQLFIVGVLFFMLYITIRRTLQGFHPARYYLPALLLQVIGISVYAAANLALLPGNAFTFYSLITTLILEMPITMFVLGYNLYNVRRLASESRRRMLIERQRIVNMLYKFMPSDMLQLLKKEITTIRLGDHAEMQMTILFADIRNFTTMSEKMSPQENFNFVNSYLQRMGPYIRNNKGFIDKYIGDAIMGLFADCAENGLDAAIDMFAELAIYNRQRTSSGYLPVDIGIGIHNGIVMLGAIGEEERMDASVISDAVNIASRIQSATKRYGSPVLITQSVIDVLQSPSQYQIRRIDRINTRGHQRPIMLYELIDCYSDARHREKLINLRSRFELGLDSMLRAEFETARGIFEEIVKQYPRDMAARAHLEQLRSWSDLKIF